ncbi:SHOCT domain-containing protein [Niallia sp. FSL K6-0212]
MKSGQNSENKQEIDTASEIRKFKELLDDGIISAEEFEDKKKQPLDL